MKENEILGSAPSQPEDFALRGQVLFYYMHDGVAEQTDKWMDGCSHIVVTVVNGRPRRTDILTEGQKDWMVR